MRDSGAFPAPEEGLAPEAAFPWPPPEDGSVSAAFVETWRDAVFHPRRFFAALPPGNTGAAVLYYLVIGILTAALQLFWETLLPAGGLLPELDPGTQIPPLANFLLSPLYLGASLLLAAGVTHVLLLVLLPTQRGFATTLRVFSYAYSPMLFAIVPRLGALAGFVWMVVIAVVGIREAHGTSTGRAATVVLVPLVLAIVLAVVAALLVAAGAVLLTP